MYSDIIKIAIKINKKTDLEFDEVADEIKINLLGLIEKLNETKGDIQQFNSSDEVSKLEYVHIKMKEDED